MLIQRPRPARASLGCLLMLFPRPFELDDSRSTTVHLSDLMHNVSSALRGWRDGGQKNRSLTSGREVGGGGGDGITKRNEWVNVGVENKGRKGRQKRGMMKLNSRAGMCA